MSEEERPEIRVYVVIQQIKILECPDCGRKLKVIISTSPEAA